MEQWTYAELVGLRLRVAAMVDHVRRTHQAIVVAHVPLMTVQLAGELAAAEIAEQRAATERYAAAAQQMAAERGRDRDLELGG